MKTLIIREQKVLFEAWSKYTDDRKAFTYYLTHTREDIFMSNAPSIFIYAFARENGLKIGILWDEREELYAGFTEFKIFLYHSFSPDKINLSKWNKIEEEILFYVQEKLWYNETPEYYEAYDKILEKMVKSNNPILLVEVLEYDSILRAYIKTSLKTNYPIVDIDNLGNDF